MTFSLRHIFYICFAAVGLAIFVYPHTVQALGVSPLRHTVTIEPGDTRIVPIFVTSESGAIVDVVPDVDAFAVDPEKGTPIFGIADDALAWVSAHESRVQVGPNNVGQINFFVTVPEGTPPGAHYLALFAKQEASDGAVGIGTRVGALLFLHVAGEVTERVEVQEARIGKSWYRKNPVAFTMHFKNTGNIHVVPQGTLVVQNWRGTVLWEEEINPQLDKILAGGEWIRSVDDIELPFFGIGKVRALLTLSYGATNKTHTVDMEFYYVPTWAYVLCTFGIIVGWIAFVETRRNKKRRR